MRSIQANSKRPSSGSHTLQVDSPDAHHADAGLLHQLDVLFQAVLRHVLLIEGGAVEERVHPVGGEAGLLLRPGAGSAQQKGDRRREPRAGFAHR